MRLATPSEIVSLGYKYQRQLFHDDIMRIAKELVGGVSVERVEIFIDGDDGSPWIYSIIAYPYNGEPVSDDDMEDDFWLSNRGPNDNWMDWMWEGMDSQIVFASERPETPKEVWIND